MANNSEFVLHSLWPAARFVFASLRQNVINSQNVARTLIQWRGTRRLGGQTMSLRIDELAEKIATLDPSEQEILLEKVAELNFQRGLTALSQKYRERLAKEGKLDQKADEVMAELGRIREEVAADDYRT
jgi:hypothetical protein